MTEVEGPRAQPEPEPFDEEKARERDRALRAFAIGVLAWGAVILPLAGLVVGLTVRAFLWAAGL